MINVLDSVFNNPGMYFLYIFLAFGALVLVIILVKKFVFNKNKEPEKIDEEKAADETLSRFLETVDDPEMQKQFDEFEKSEEENK